MCLHIDLLSIKETKFSANIFLIPLTLKINFENIEIVTTLLLTKYKVFR